MSIASNLNTRQNPMSAAGRTGTQVTKFVAAPRVYVKAVDSASSPFTSTPFPLQTLYKKTANGVLDASYTGFTDLGIVNGFATITYTKKTTDVRTGMDSIFRAQYVSEKDASIEFVLDQFDDVVLEAVGGLTASVISSGSVVNYLVGQEDIVQMQLLLVAINKLDGKEIQFFNPAAYVNFAYDSTATGLALKVTGTLPAFTADGTSGALGEAFMSTSVFK